MEHRFVQNPNWIAFGYESINYTQEEITKILYELEEDFNHIMIIEYLLESLILLKEDLNLTYDEVSSLRKNVAINKESKIGEEFKPSLRAWQSLDVALYNHFNRTLWKRIEKFGYDRMKEEVETLRQMNIDNAKECVDQYIPVAELPAEFRDWQPIGVEIKGIKLRLDATER